MGLYMFFHSITDTLFLSSCYPSTNTSVLFSASLVVTPAHLLLHLSHDHRPSKQLRGADHLSKRRHVVFHPDMGMPSQSKNMNTTLGPENAMKNMH
jgi:hypothetical protein